jgi:NitT/TauT family transport system ATP-binding protein
VILPHDATSDVLVRDLSVSYRNQDGSKKMAVDGVSLSVFPGEIVTIVGPSGCGKTTILRALLGSVDFSGVCRLNALREKDLSYLQQVPALLPWRTALENAALGQEVRRTMSADSIRRVEELLSDFGLGGRTLLSYPYELSTGMQQRVAIARALESSPRVLLCDEPFSAIDFINRLKLNRIFKQRCAARVSVLMVTHNIDEAIFLSSRIAVMSGSPGRIATIVTPRFDDFIEDPVVMRERPEFAKYFDEVWQAMGKYEQN